MLRQAVRVLKPGGYLYLTTDNITNLAAIFSMMRGDSPNGPLSLSTVLSRPKNNWRGHARLYSQKELEEIHEAVGLTVVSMKQFWNKQWYSLGIHSPVEQLVRNYVAWVVPAPYRGHHELIAQKPL